MKKIAMMAWLSFVCTLCLKAQSNQPANPLKDKIDFQGYTVTLLPAIGGTYGYNILKGKSLILHQSFNPFNMAPEGMRNKNDAYKIAKWQIVHFNLQNKSSFAANISTPQDIHNLQPENQKKTFQTNQKLSKEIAKELNITIQ
ncbi:DUF4907 domain-containing protein [Segetibacter koreensis]|uniref:DUF4907 domain-containing protein n=1 Tax=Segetibacter koreensis TaxID=398037 RepID=UPI00037FC9ED|nr:DUF4907 domain-containing protein [Segetibacter koreensis]